MVRVPFGWHQAPGLVQHLIATVIAHVDPAGVVVLQYLDDICGWEAEARGPQGDARCAE